MSADLRSGGPVDVQRAPRGSTVASPTSLRLRHTAGCDVSFPLRVGFDDYFIRIAVTDLATYETFLTSKLMDTPGLATVDSHITMKTIKAND